MYDLQQRPNSLKLINTSKFHCFLTVGNTLTKMILCCDLKKKKKSPRIIYAFLFTCADLLGSGSDLSVVECCQGTNKSLVTHQLQDAIQEELVVSSTMVALWLHVSRGCEEARVMCYCCQASI